MVNGSAGFLHAVKCQIQSGHNGWSHSWLQGSCLFLSDPAYTGSACISGDRDMVMTAVGDTPTSHVLLTPGPSPNGTD